MLREVFIAEQTAVLCHVAVNSFRNVAFVKDVTTTVGDLLQCVGEPRILEHFAFLRRTATRHVSFGEAGVLPDALFIHVKIKRDGLGYGEPVSCIGDRRCE